LRQGRRSRALPTVATSSTSKTNDGTLLLPPRSAGALIAVRLPANRATLLLRRQFAHPPVFIRAESCENLPRNAKVGIGPHIVLIFRRFGQTERHLRNVFRGWSVHFLPHLRIATAHAWLVLRLDTSPGVGRDTSPTRKRSTPEVRSRWWIKGGPLRDSACSPLNANCLLISHTGNLIGPSPFVTLIAFHPGSSLKSAGPRSSRIGREIGACLGLFLLRRGRVETSLISPTLTVTIVAQSAGFSITVIFHVGRSLSSSTLTLTPLESHPSLPWLG